MIITIIIIVIVVVMVLKLLESMGKALPYVILFGAVYALHFVIWDFLCWIIGILLCIGLIKAKWDETHTKKEYL